MFIKDEDALNKNALQQQGNNKDLFNYHLHRIVDFSKRFDPQETLMLIAMDDFKRKSIINAGDEPVSLDYILKELWPKLGLLNKDKR